MNEIELYNYLTNKLSKLAELYNIQNLDEYYISTDLKNENISSLKGIPQVFAQYILHAQNGTMISGVVNFNKNYKFIKEILCNFEPKNIISTYKISIKGNNNNISANLIVNEFRKYLHWTTAKSKKPDSIITRFANSVIDGAIYFSKFDNKQKLIDDLNIHYENKNFRKLIDYLLDNFKHGFSVALCCDFLKELDPIFDLPKPDIHLMEVIAKFKGYDNNHYKNSDKKALKCIDDIIEIVNRIKSNPHGDSNLTVYKFDRIVWLCCTGNFFLNNTDNSLKANLLKGII